MAGTLASVNGKPGCTQFHHPAAPPKARRKVFARSSPGSHEGHIKWPSARAELAINLISRPSGATRELSQRYRARHSEKSVQQNGDADSDLGMVFAARTGPLGSSVHFWEYSADQDGCIRAGHTLLAPKTPSTGDLGRRANPVRTKRRASRRTGPQNDVDLRNTTRLQRHRQSSRC